MLFGGSYVSAPDPFRLTDIAINPGYNNRAGKTLVYPPLVGGEDTAVILMPGQSLFGNTCDGAYSIVNSRNHQINIYDGGIYETAGALLGCSSSFGHHVGSRLADKLITAATYERVILVPVAIGGTLVSQWAPGGDVHHRIGVTKERLDAHGLTTTFILWHQGESDAIAGTSQSAYATSLQDVIDSFTDLGVTAPFFVALATYFDSALPAGSAAVRAGQAQVVDNVNVFQGADTDTLTGANRSDGTHLSAAGANAHADLWKAAIDAYLA